jgi:hypothetical protein
MARNRDTIPHGPWIDLDGVLLRLQKSVNAAGGQRAWGRKHDIDPAHINKVLKGQKIPSEKFTRALGLEGALLWRTPAH